MITMRLTAWCVVLAVAAPTPAAAQEPSLATVLQRAADYVADFHRQLSGVVAEERYVQEVKAFAKGAVPLANPSRIALRSDLLLVRPANGGEWTEFRDVFEVNGNPIRDRTERLVRLFLDGSPSAHQQIAQIMAESARFNIGDIERNINTPVFALQILEATKQSHFVFSRSRNPVPDTFSKENTPTAPFRASTEIWIVEYREQQRGTIIRVQQLKDLPAHGRFWIEPSTGRVLMSELIASDGSLSATVDVSYQSEPLLGLLVPVEMREKYHDRRGGRIEAVATYGRFRQFQVNVDEKFLLKK